MDPMIYSRILERLISNDTTLTMLKLWGRHIGDEGAHSLATALEHNSTLTRLYLTTNNIGDEGARFFAAALERNTTLTELSLWGSRIGDEGTRCLAIALERNRTLTVLDLITNIRNEVRVSIDRSICRNRAIRTAWKKGRRRKALLLWVGVRTRPRL